MKTLVRSTGNVDGVIDLLRVWVFVVDHNWKDCKTTLINIERYDVLVQMQVKWYS